MDFQNPWFYAEEEKKMCEAQREVWLAEAKTTAIEQARINAMYAKSAVKEKEDERRKSKYEEIVVDSTGEIFVRTRNLCIPAKARSIVNFSSPKLAKIVRISKEYEFAFCFEFTIDKRVVDTFFSEEKIGDRNYIYRKIKGAGGTFFCENISRAKGYASDLISRLIPDSEVRFVPDYPGWMRLPSGKFKFVEKGELTWKTVEKKIR